MRSPSRAVRYTIWTLHALMQGAQRRTTTFVQSCWGTPHTARRQQPGGHPAVPLHHLLLLSCSTCSQAAVQLCAWPNLACRMTSSM